MNRRMTSLAAGLVTLIPAAVATIVLTSEANAATGCQVAYAVTSQWSGGFQGAVTITNTADALSGWTLAFTFPDDEQSVAQSWNATFSQSGTAVTFTNAAWNSSIATNASASFGFVGSNGATNPVPTEFSLNGVSCLGSSATSAAASTAASTATSAAASGTSATASAAVSSTGSASASTSTYFSLLEPDADLPSAADCATLVSATPIAENKGVNATANQTTGHAVSGASAPLDQIDGNYTGTTEQILRWAACKWGIDEDLVKAQAAIESWWHMDTLGDWGTDATLCPSNHGLGVDGTAGSCPQSYGIMQIRYPYNVAAFPGAETSTAMNVDYAFANWRACYTGSWTWLNTVERGSDYAAGDEWGCMGVWFSGRWHTTAADEYIARVKDYLSQRIWETTDFQQP